MTTQTESNIPRGIFSSMNNSSVLYKGVILMRLNLAHILVLAVLAFIAYWAYKKYIRK